MYSSVGNGMEISMNMMQARNDRRGKRAELPDDIARKLKSCSVLNCEDWRDLSSYTTYHCFPTGEKNQDRWEIWTQLLRKAREDESWIPFRGSLVCSHHFRPEDFVNEPLSKRRKLIKNAIPSVFPSFTVDLDDPSYQLPDDDGTEVEGNGISEQEEYVYADSADSTSFLNLAGEEGGYEYEYASEEADEVQGNLGQMEEADDSDIQFINDINELSSSTTASVSTGYQRKRPSSSSNKSLPALITSIGQVQVMSTSSVLLQQQKQKKQHNMLQLQIPPNQVIHLNNDSSSHRISHSIKSGNKSRVQQQQRGSAVSSLLMNQNVMQPKKLIRQQEAVKALNSLPFSLDPDLEIEMVDPEEDLATCRNRIIELEQQNRSLTTMYENALETLKHKYESQLLFLRKRLKEQDRLLHVHQTSTNNISSAKKIRLS